MFWRLKAIKFPFKRKKDEQQIVIDVKSVETAKERIKAAIEPAQVKKSSIRKCRCHRSFRKSSGERE